MNATVSRTHPRLHRYSRPHTRQAQTWTRFAQMLPTVRARACQRKEEALAWSLQKNSKGFAIPVRIPREVGFGFGWDRLGRVMAEVRFPELEAKVLYDETTDTESVALYVHYVTKKGRSKASIGCLPAFDAQWMIPLLQDGFAPWMHIFVVSKDADTVEIAISGSWVAAHYWMDAYDDRRTATFDRETSESENAVGVYVRKRSPSARSEDARREITDLQDRMNDALLEMNAREEIGQSNNHLEAYVASLSGQIAYLKHRSRQLKAACVDEPTVEDWLREDISLREVPFSDLDGGDFWAVQNM